MDQVFQIFLSHEIELCVSALVISPEWNRLPAVLSHEIVLCISALVISPEWNRLPAVFISRDCIMHLRSYLTRMEQAFQLFLSHEIVVCVSALVSPEWSSPSSCSHHIEVQNSALAASGPR
jgi:hypothetical protein